MAVGTLWNATLYAVTAHRYHPDEPLWRDYRQFFKAQLPARANEWLLDRSSLTQYLLKASQNHFKVRVLGHYWGRPFGSECRLLEVPESRIAIIREVLLCCHDQPWIFARSVIPATTLTGPLRRLRRFADRSLGELLFSEPSMQRHPFEIAKIAGHHNHLPREVQGDESIWGRRCRFELCDRPLMVSEFYLPAFQPPHAL